MKTIFGPSKKRESILKPHRGDRVKPGAVSAPGYEPNETEKPHSGRPKTVYSTDRRSIHRIATGPEPSGNSIADSVPTMCTAAPPIPTVRHDHIPR